MPDVGAAASSILDTIGSFFSKIGEIFEATHVPQQTLEVDAAGLFTNPWFLVPFVAFVGYLIYKQKFRDMIILAIIIGLWWLSGTEYMQTLVVGDELQVKKVLPVLFGGAAILGFVIYLFFGRG